MTTVSTFDLVPQPVSPSGVPGGVHRGAAVLQQPSGGGQSGHAATHERLPLQEGHGDLQLQLL